MTGFKVGDRVRISPTFPSPRRGSPGTVRGVHGGDAVEVDVDGHGGGYVYASIHLELLTPSEPAKEAWVEVDRNETHRLWRHSDGQEMVAELHRVPDKDHPWARAAAGTFELGQRGFRWLRDSPRTGGASEVGYIPREPAEAKPEAQREEDGREECAQCHIRALHTVNGKCRACHQAKKPAAQPKCQHQGISATGQCLACGKELGVWDSDRYHGIVKSDLDTRIAAARAEMAKSSEERKRKLGRFDGGPWQVWPKGQDDEP